MIKDNERHNLPKKNIYSSVETAVLLGVITPAIFLFGNFSEKETSYQKIQKTKTAEQSLSPEIINPFNLSVDEFANLIFNGQNPERFYPQKENEIKYFNK